MTFTSKLLQFIQKYINILSPDDKEKLLNIHIDLIYIENYIITYCQNYEKSEDVVDDSKIQEEHLQHYSKYIQQKMNAEHEAQQIMTSYQIL